MLSKGSLLFLRTKAKIRSRSFCRPIPLLILPIKLRLVPLLTPKTLILRCYIAISPYSSLYLYIPYASKRIALNLIIYPPYL